MLVWWSACIKDSWGVVLGSETANVASERPRAWVWPRVQYERAHFKNWTLKRAVGLSQHKKDGLAGRPANSSNCGRDEPAAAEGQLCTGTTGGRYQSGLGSRFPARWYRFDPELRTSFASRASAAPFAARQAAMHAGCMPASLCQSLPVPASPFRRAGMSPANAGEREPCQIVARSM